MGRSSSKRTAQSEPSFEPSRESCRPMPTLTWPYVHIAINHFPIILTIVGTAVLALAIVRGNRGTWLYALATLTLAGISVSLVFFTGDQAADVVRDTWYIVRDAVREHNDAAWWALVSLLAAGVASGYAWWWMLRRDTVGLPPKWLRAVVSVLAVWALAVVVR